MKKHPIVSFAQAQSSWTSFVSLDASLRSKTSFQCSAHAGVIVAPPDQPALEEVLKTFFQEGFVLSKDYAVLGKGSNLLIEDGGYPGCLLDLTHFKDIQTLEKDATWVMDVDAGVGMGTLLNKLRKEAYTGFEFTFGIPGSIGGGIVMNAGTPEGWFDQCVQVVYGFDAKGEPFDKVVTPEDFAYRSFPFGQDKIITGGQFVFQKIHADEVEHNISISKDKRARQPLTFPNFGSVFKNPKPKFSGALIEDVGLKGHRIGDAEISSKHANFIINHGQARVEDVKKLINLCQNQVYDVHNIMLEPEVHIIGVTLS